MRRLLTVTTTMMRMMTRERPLARMIMMMYITETMMVVMWRIPRRMERRRMRVGGWRNRVGVPAGRREVAPAAVVVRGVRAGQHRRPLRVVSVLVRVMVVGRGRLIAWMAEWRVVGPVVTRWGVLVTRWGVLVTRRGVVVTRRGVVVTRRGVVVTRRGVMVTGW
jgi:hypothetical protein